MLWRSRLKRTANMLSAKQIPKNIGVGVPPVVSKPTPVKEAVDNHEFVGVGLRGVLSSTEKLLAINRGLEEPDERDSYGFKHIFGVDKHLGERINLDAGKIKQGLMRNAAKTKSLRGAYPFLFDAYTKGLLLGDPGDANPLSAPGEEVNPLHILEAAYRITQMGPGGIGTSTAITTDAQNVHNSQFGFVDPIAGPESEKAGVDARLATGVRIGSDGRLYQQFRNRRTQNMEWLTPDDLETKNVAMPK